MRLGWALNAGHTVRKLLTQKLSRQSKPFEVRWTRKALNPLVDKRHIFIVAYLFPRYACLMLSSVFLEQVVHRVTIMWTSGGRVGVLFTSPLKHRGISYSVSVQPGKPRWCLILRQNLGPTARTGEVKGRVPLASYLHRLKQK
jgi:hypothetical protein